MSIFRSCLPEPGKCPGKPPIDLPDQPNELIYCLFDVTFEPGSYPTGIGEGTTVVSVNGIKFCDFKGCPLDTPRNPI